MPPSTTPVVLFLRTLSENTSLARRVASAGWATNADNRCRNGDSSGYSDCVLHDRRSRRLFDMWMCHLPWNLKVVAWDVGLVGVVSITSAYAYSAMAMAHGHMDSGVKWILLTAASSVVVRHLIRLALRSAHR